MDDHRSGVRISFSNLLGHIANRFGDRNSMSTSLNRARALKS